MMSTAKLTWIYYILSLLNICIKVAHCFAAAIAASVVAVDGIDETLQ